MLPKDLQTQKDKTQHVRQSQLDAHLQPVPIKYSDERFRAAIVEWLVDTDQVHGVYLYRRALANFYYKPISALERPSLKKVIEIAAQATNGVQMPSRKYVRTLIIDTFKDQMIKLRSQLLVCLCSTACVLIN